MIKNFCLGDNEKKLNKIAANSKKNTIFALAKLRTALLFRNRLKINAIQKHFSKNRLK